MAAPLRTPAAARDVVHREILALDAYRVADSAGMVKLDAMESPYGLDESLRQSWLETLSAVQINRYPDADGRQVTERLRKVFGIPDSLEILLGNGSDELLQLIQIATAGSGRTVMSPMPSFSMYEIIARYTRGRFASVTLDDNFELDPDAWFDALRREQPDCVFFAYPNNPTGTLFDPSVIERTAQLISGAVVVDEAYYAYAQRSLMDLAQRQGNVLIVRTLSKSGLAGLRLGYLVGDRSWIRELNKVRMPYNVNVLTGVSVAFALDRWDAFDAHAEQIRSQRSALARMLESIGGLRVYPSHANFITFRTETHTADELHMALKSSGILIKNLHGSHPQLNNCLRVTVSTETENQQFAQALGALV